MIVCVFYYLSLNKCTAKSGMGPVHDTLPTACHTFRYTFYHPECLDESEE